MTIFTYKKKKNSVILNIKNLSELNYIQTCEKILTYNIKLKLIKNV